MLYSIDAIARAVRATSARHSVRAGGFLAVLALLAAATPLSASEPIVRIEEDWVLKVGTPSSALATPQITCTMSPVCHADDLHFVFELNHQTSPDFVAGGMQIHVWENDSRIESRKFPRDEVLQNEFELIRWTQVLLLNNGSVQFEVVGGESLSWGKFGGQGYLRASNSTKLIDLGDYRKTCSTENSGISFAADFEGKMGLVEVRRYSSKGLVDRDTEVFLFR